jgi:hypothetical protein
MPDETFRQLGPLLTQEERSVLIDIEITLGCATCLWDGPPTGAIREALRSIVLVLTTAERARAG